MTLKRNLAANVLGQGWVAAMSLAFIPVYVDRLGVEAYGLIGFYAVLQGWMSLLDMGLSPTIGREMARAGAGTHTAESIADLLRSVEAAILALAILSGLLVWSAAGWLADHWFTPVELERDAVAGAIAVMALVVTLRAGEGIYRGALFGMERQVWYNAAAALLATVRGAGGAVVVWALPSVSAFFWWQAAVSLLTLGVLAIGTRRFMPRPARRPRVSADALRRVGGFAGGMSLTVLSGLLVSHLDKLILARILDLDDYGRYMLAVSVAGILSLAAGPVAAAFAPRLAADVARGDAVAGGAHFRLAAQVAAVAVLPAAALLVLMPEVLLYAWTGDRALAAATGAILPFLAVAAAVNAALTIPYVLQIAHGDTRLAIRVNVGALAALLPGVVLGATLAGGTGAAMAAATVGAGILAASAAQIFRRTLPHEGGTWVRRGLLAPGVAAAAMVGLVLLTVAPSGRASAALATLAAGALATIAAAAMCPEIVRRWPGLRRSVGLR